jgi:hypothetical protein
MGIGFSSSEIGVEVEVVMRGLGARVGGRRDFDAGGGERNVDVGPGDRIAFGR